MGWAVLALMSGWRTPERQGKMTEGPREEPDLGDSNQTHNGLREDCMLRASPFIRGLCPVSPFAMGKYFLPPNNYPKVCCLNMFPGKVVQKEVKGKAEISRAP